MDRECRKCRALAPIASFPKNSTSIGGRAWVCKNCKNARRRETRASPAAKAHEQETRRAWYYEKGGKLTVARNVRAYRARTGYPGWSDPVRQRARIATQTAIRRGRLIRGPCEECGAGETHAHHDDYLKPLEVRWLCGPCHHAVHHPTIRALVKK